MPSNPLKSELLTTRALMGGDMSEVYARLYRSPRYFSELLLKIKTKDAQIAPMIYNYSQRILYKTVQQIRQQRKPVRVIVVKARQVGISTGISSIVYHHTTTRSNVTSLITSHDMDSSENIFRMYRLFYDKTDDGFKPMTKYSNRKELLFENPNDEKRQLSPGLNSRIMVDTSRTVSIGRSFTLNNCHLSEVAFMDNAEELMLGVEEAVPMLPDTAIFLESTANGMGNYFHKKCEAASKRRGDYVLVFIPWFWAKEYTIHDLHALGTLGDHEKSEYGNELELSKKFKVSEPQLRWRRMKIENSFDGNVQKFQQEYPSYWQEAFIFSGQPLFPTKTLIAMKEACPAPISRGDIIHGKGSQYSFLPGDRGSLSVWVDPVPQGTYVIGADTAEGIDGGDRSTVDIVDVRTLTQVAHWCGIIPPDELAYVIYYLGKKYLDALVGVEVNNHGLLTVVTLQKLQYWNQYKRISFDSQKKKRRDALGWKTTSITKPLMIDGLRQFVKAGEVIINNPETIEEMLTFVKHEDGSLGAAVGSHDDRVISLAIAVEMARQAFIRPGLKPLRKSSKITFGDIDRMVDDLNERKSQLPGMGSWRGYGVY